MTGRRIQGVAFALLIAAGAASALPAPAQAGLAVEPFVASRQLTGDASDLFDGGFARGIAVSYLLPMIPLRPRVGIDFSDHDAKTGSEQLDGTVISVDVLIDLGAGLFVPYALVGLGVSNLDGKPTPNEVKDAYDTGKAFGRAGAGARLGLGRKLAVAGELSYARGGKGNELISGEIGELAFFDLRLSALISF